jgi:ferredoxin
MKHLITHPEKCIGCNICANECSLAFFKEKNPEKSSIQIIKKDDKIEINVCNQCGDCVAMCPTQALSVSQHGIVAISKNDCVGCLVCVAECPTGAMKCHHTEKIPFKCSACSICTSKCPKQAIELIRE